MSFRPDSPSRGSHPEAPQYQSFRPDSPSKGPLPDAPQYQSYRPDSPSKGPLPDAPAIGKFPSFNNVPEPTHFGSFDFETPKFAMPQMGSPVDFSGSQGIPKDGAMSMKGMGDFDMSKQFSTSHFDFEGEDMQQPDVQMPAMNMSGFGDLKGFSAKNVGGGMPSSGGAPDFGIPDNGFVAPKFDFGKQTGGIPGFGGNSSYGFNGHMAGVASSYRGDLMGPSGFKPTFQAPGW